MSEKRKEEARRGLLNPESFLSSVSDPSTHCYIARNARISQRLFIFVAILAFLFFSFDPRRGAICLTGKPVEARNDVVMKG